MSFISLADVDLMALGLLGAIEDTTRGTLTFRFVDRDEVWTAQRDVQHRLGDLNRWIPIAWKPRP